MGGEPAAGPLPADLRRADRRPTRGELGSRGSLGVSLRGALWVAGATIALGASGYAFLTLTARLVPAEEYAALASLYLLVALVGPALFVPVEQETARLVSRAQIRRVGTRDQVRRSAQLAAAMAIVAVLGLLVLYPVLVHRVFHGSTGLWLALVISVVGYAGACTVRGVFAGQRRLRPYGLCVGADGVARLLPCVALAAAGVAAALPYGLALGLGPVVALAVVLPWFRPGTPGPRVGWRELISATGWLVAAWGLSLLLANIAPVIVTALHPDDPRLAGIFAFAFVVARVPVFVLVSLQAILLPALTRAAAAQDRDGLRQGVRHALLLVAGLGLVSLAVTVPLCRWLLDVLFAATNGRTAGEALSVGVLLLLAAGTVTAMFLQVLQPALIAVAGHRLVAAAWALGTVVFASAFALPLPAVPAAALAQVAAGTATVAVMTVALRRHLRG